MIVSNNNTNNNNGSNRRVDMININHNNSNNNFNLSNRSLNSALTTNHEDLVQQLKDGIEIKDRKWRVKTYKQCFLHSEAIAWMIQNNPSTKDETSAVDLLNELRLEGYIQHVVDPNKPFKIGLGSKKLYYCFLVDHSSIHHHHDRISSVSIIPVIPRRKGFFSRKQEHHLSKSIPQITSSSREQQQQESSFNDLCLKLNHMESTILKMAEMQRSTTTKLEIVHQATISLIQDMVATALLLLLLAIYVLYGIVPSIDYNNSRLMLLSISFIGTVAIGTFIVYCLNLFSIWLELDTSVFEAAAMEGGDCYDDAMSILGGEDSIVTTTTTTTTLPRNLQIQQQQQQQGTKQRSGSTRRRRPRQSSLIMKEPLMRMNGGGILSSSTKSKSSMSSSTTKTILQPRKASDIPLPVSIWPHRPVLVCANNTPNNDGQKQTPMKVPKYGNGPCPIGIPFEFESDLFVGQCLIRIKGVSGDVNDGSSTNNDDTASSSSASSLMIEEQDDKYFTGRRRLFQTIVQGKFKQPLKVSDVLTGHEFFDPLKRLPHPWILKAATNIIGKLAPGAEIRVLGDNPTMLASLAATSQIVRGDEPGNEPDLALTYDNDIEEDCSLLGGKFATGKTTSSMGRKLHLANPHRASKYTFDTETIYTFDFYQSLLNVQTYSLDLGIASINMVPILNGQPIQCLCKTIDNQYLWNFQIWHESLLPLQLQASSSSSPSSSPTSSLSPSTRSLVSNNTLDNNGNEKDDEKKGNRHFRKMKST